MIFQFLIFSRLKISITHIYFKKAECNLKKYPVNYEKR